ncbi:MAG TPA: glycosyltransferase family 39 protein [Planctomycetota bacterium]|nr:glycosyltransferase family 39 protein [Planctomycetota bacterium]
MSGAPRTSRRELVLLLAIVLAGAALRLAGLGSLPRGLHPDEAANALETLSILRDGRSTDGRALPLVFDHHGVDWVEGTYVWLSAPFVALAGDHVETGVRLLAALAGTGAVAATFFLARRLGGTRTGLLAAAILAIEPWAVHHSRFGDRATLEPVLLASGLALGLSGLDDRRARRAALGGVLLGLAVATYAPARLVVPLIALALVLGWEGPRATKLAFLAPVLLAGLAVLPFALSERGLLRLREIGVLSPVTALGGYARCLSPRTLFTGAEGQGFLAKGVPPLHVFEGPLILAGIVAAWRERRLRFLLGWLAAFPLASAFTVPSPNLLRATFGVPLLAVLGALGAASLVDRFGPKRVSAILAPAALACLGVSIYLYVAVFPATTSAWAPYAGEREEVARLHGRVHLEKPHEKALVDLYARGRPHTWASGTDVTFGD